MAMVRLAEGDPDGALELLGEAERLYTGDFSPDARPIAAMKARVWIAQGRLASAWAWARERGISADRRPDVPARVRARHPGQAAPRAGHARPRRRPLDEANGLAERLLAAAAAGGRDGSAIEILVVLALARDARGDQAGATAFLERALTLAEPEGYVRVFIDEGPPMTALLRLIAKERSAPTYVRQLLAATVTTARDGQPAAAPDRTIERHGSSRSCASWTATSTARTSPASSRCR